MSDLKSDDLRLLLRFFKNSNWVNEKFASAKFKKKSSYYSIHVKPSIAIGGTYLFSV